MPPFPSLLILSAPRRPGARLYRAAAEALLARTGRDRRRRDPQPGVILCGFVFQGGSLGECRSLAHRGPAFFCYFTGHHAFGHPRLLGGSRGRQRLARGSVGPRAASGLPSDDRVLAAWRLLYCLDGSHRRPGSDRAPDRALCNAADHRSERHLRRRPEPRRNDGLMALALIYILWFVAVPLWVLT